jgi:hypothetical protein
MSETPNERARELQTGQDAAAVEEAAAAAGDREIAARLRRLETPGAFIIMTIYSAVFVVLWLLVYVYLAVRWAVE